MATSNKLDVLKTDIPYSWLNFFKISCSQCFNEFSSFEKENSHRPVLLNCSHIACDYCIGRGTLKFYKCRTCNESTYFDITRDVRLQTTLNQYLDGVLNFKRYVIPYRENLLNKTAPVAQIENTEECFECYSKDLLKYCLVCEVIYCSSCFTSIHESAKVLRKHRYNVLVIDPNDTDNLDTSTFCTIHRSEKSSFYCKDCNETCCINCNKDNHKNHNITSIREENTKYKYKVEVILGLIAKAQTENESSKLKLEDFYNCHNKHLTESIEKITNNFIYLHGVLQNIELEYINEIKDSYKQILDEIKVIETTLSVNDLTFTKNSNKLHSYKIEIPKHEYILSELQKIELSICSLPVSVNFDNPSTSPINFKELKSLNDEIKSFFQLDIKLDTFNKFSKNILGATSEIMSDSKHNNTNISEVEPNLTISKDKSETNRTTNILNQHFKKQKPGVNANIPSCSGKRKLKVPTELVHVSHIKNAGCFYVQNQVFLRKSEDFKEMCISEGKSALVPACIESNVVYLIQQQQQNLYYRGIVQDDTFNKTQFTVFFIDYGSTEKNVKTKRFRIASPYLIGQPHAARLCSIYNIKFTKSQVPKQVQLMSDIIRDQQMTMVILYEKDGVNYVDLFNNNANKISLRDALLFCDVITKNITNDIISTEKINSLEEYKREFIYSKTTRKVLNNIFKVGEYFKICMKHIVSPAEFYAMKADHVELINEMNHKLNEFCVKTPNFIYYPQLLTNCAVHGSNGLWNRGLITKILPTNLVEVKLIDLGLKEIVSRQKLMYLDQSFCSISEGVIKCQLSDVQPQKEDNYTFPEDIIEKFKDLSLSSNLHLNVNKIVNGKIEVNLHIIQSNQEICVNDLLNNNTNYQIDCARYSDMPTINFDMNVASTSKPMIPDTNTQGIKRTKVSVLNVCSPSEIYVCIDTFLPGLRKLHINIQKFMETDKNNIKTKPVWNENEKCFVNTKLEKNLRKQWYRGIIQSVDKNDKNMFRILLRDKGCYVTEHYNYITETNDVLGNIGCGSIKCELSCVRPTGNNITWPSFVIDEFRELVNTYEEHAVTLYGEKLESGIRKCYRVILWGLSIECEDALSPAEMQWNNLNMILADNGLCHLTQKFSEIEKQVALETENITNDINEYLKNFDMHLSVLTGALATNLNINNENDENCQTTSDDEFSNAFTPIENWLKCEPIKKSQFVAIPTYVDNDAVIYLHEHDAKVKLGRIKQVIKKVYENSQPDSISNSTWEIGQSCIAKYHADKMYYRAKILEKINEKLYQIEFVDYGNIEECSPSDLRRNVILGNIPIQAHKYCLKDIEPITPIWTTDIVDIIHAKVVLQMCTIRVNWQAHEYEELDVVPCQITINSIDLSQFLVSQKFAKFKNENNKSSSVFERFHSHRFQDKEYFGPSIDSVKRKEQSINYNNMASMFHETSSISPDVIIVNKTSDDSNESDNEETTSFDDSNFETSTQYLQMYEFSPFKMAEIQSDVHGFNGTVIKIISSTDIIISTKFEKLNSKYKQMMDTIQYKALTCQPVQNIYIGLSCIAWNETDNLWHRGLIKGYNQTEALFTVLLVDKMHLIKVESSQIKITPSGCQNYPLLYLRVTFNRVKPNRRLRETDIINELSTLLLGKTFYVKIIKRISPTPIVELYKDNKCEILVYQTLIEKKFLHLINFLTNV